MTVQWNIKQFIMLQLCLHTEKCKNTKIVFLSQLICLIKKRENKSLKYMQY